MQATACRLHLCIALTLAGLLLSASPAFGADTLVVDFETGPALNTPVNDEYLGSHFLRFIKDDPGFRPYRRSVPGLARSGSVAADVGGSVCLAETGDGVLCEFPSVGTNGRLTRTATTVTLYAGFFSDPGEPTSARLVARNASDQIVATGAFVPIDHLGFDAPVTVTSAGNDIARFTLELNGGSGQALGFDDLTLEYPEGTLPEVSLVVPSGPVTVLQGSSVDLPVSVIRLNGSNGPLDLSVTGLPTGVSAELIPDPVPGTQTAATLRLTATGTAPTFFVPAELTVTADPSGNALVAPGPRSAKTLITVRTNFELAQAPPGPVALPRCGTVDLTLRINRDIAFATNKTVSLSAEGLPPSVTAEFLPGATVPPGGGLIAEPTLRLRRDLGTLPAGSSALIRATSAGAPTRTIVIPLAHENSAASLDPSSVSGAVPSRLRPGSTIRMTGNGFCAGTKVQVGNALGLADPQIEPGGKALSFEVPRLATSGSVTVVPPSGGQQYQSSNAITIRSPRNHTGFAFDNPSYDNLSFTELADFVGYDEMFASVNPCWPLGSCPIITIIPNPVALLKWQIIEQVLQESGGHCFGINRTIQEVGAGRLKLNRFASGLTKNFDMPSPSGPIGSFESWLDQRHAGQTTNEFLLTYGARLDSISAQLARVRAELEAGRLPGLTLKNSFTEGHVITAHDVETLADGRTIVHTYDNERPFLPEEDADTSGAIHRDREEGSSVVINAAKSRWEYSGWSGGNDGSFYATKLTDFPANPSLPGVAEAIIGIFGSKGGAAVTGAKAAGGEVVPVFDRNATPGATGFVIGDAGAKSLSHVMNGKRDGTYSQMITGGGFLGEVRGVQTAKGVTDRLTGTPNQSLIRFAGERSRRLNLSVAEEVGGSSRAATIQTGTSGGGSDTAQLKRGRSLVFKHDGAATSFSFSLSAAEPGASAAHFESGPLRVGRGERIVATPASWKSLSPVRLSVKRGTRVRTRLLRNRAKGPSVRISIGAPRVSSRGGGRVLRVTVRLRRLRAKGAQGVVLRLTRKGRAVATRSFAVRRARNGARTFSWRLPGGLHGPHYWLTPPDNAATPIGRCDHRTPDRSLWGRYLRRGDGPDRSEPLPRLCRRRVCRPGLDTALAEQPFRLLDQYSWWDKR